MGPVVQLVVPDAAVVVAGVLAACALLAVAVLLLRARRGRQLSLDEALVRSHEVAALSRKVEELSQEVARSRRAADEDRQYVITSLADAGVDIDAETDRGRLADRSAPHASLVPVPATLGSERPPVGKVLEEHLVEALARQQGGSPVRRRWTDTVVGAVALGHGVRRALSADVLDRAAAEAHVARRRSRRARRRQVRRSRREVA